MSDLYWDKNLESIKSDLHVTKIKKEKFVLVHVATGKDLLNYADSLIELSELVKTSGGEVVGELIQNLEKFNPKHYVGKGKVEEIESLVSLLDADGIVCDHELTSVQLKNLEELLNVKILDRTLVILDIFANRANSAEGKLQVELAQLKYRRAHLLGIGKSLSQQGGGIGTRGPGEKKLETDRRLINDRISDLSKVLKEVENNRKIRRESHNKNKIPMVSMVGYTNAGKSSLLNYLTDADVLAEDKLFATLDTTTRGVTLLGGSNILFVDTVGFIEKLPHALIQAFKSTLEELKYADVIVHVVDGSSSIREIQMKTVYNTLTDLQCSEIPIITVFNKKDKGFEYPLPIDDFSRKCVEISAKNGDGIDDLKEEIETILKSFRKSIKFILPYSEGTLAGVIHQKSEIILEEYKEEGILFHIYADEKIYNKVKKYEII